MEVRTIRLVNPRKIGCLVHHKHGQALTGEPAGDQGASGHQHVPPSRSRALYACLPAAAILANSATPPVAGHGLQHCRFAASKCVPENVASRTVARSVFLEGLDGGRQLGLGSRDTADTKRETHSPSRRSLMTLCPIALFEFCTFFDVSCEKIDIGLPTKMG